MYFSSVKQDGFKVLYERDEVEFGIAQGRGYRQLTGEVLGIRKADPQTSGGIEIPGALLARRLDDIMVGAMVQMTILMRGYEWPEKGETFPGGVPKGEWSRNPLKQSAPVVEKS